MIRGASYKALLREFNLDAVYTIDFETFWSKDYSLSKMPTTEYVYDDRFEIHVASVMKDSWAKAKVMEHDELRAFLRGVDWKRNGMLAHNTMFDGLILHRHFGVQPAALFDTLSMSRPLMPISVGNSLVKLMAAFGRSAKKHGGVLGSTQGRRWSDFTPSEKKTMKLYAGEDAVDCWFLFDKMLPYLPIQELKLIDMTLKMYCRPRLLLNSDLLAKIVEDDKRRVDDFLQSSGVSIKALRSNDQFAAVLTELGVAPPMKISKTTGEETYAFSKTDEEFIALQNHDDPVVVAAVNARIGAKSTISASRAERMYRRSAYGPQPVGYKYAGAKTLRWSGTDSMNWQNFPRKEKSPLRRSIVAPDGHVLIIADSSQIEARINAWFNKQANVVAAFAAKQDVYALQAAEIYGRPINKDDNPEERFVGKVAVLSLGYQAGGPRFGAMLRLGSMGPPVDVTDSQASDIVRAWRAANPFIVAGWKRVLNNAKSAFATHTTVDDGVITFEGAKDRGMIHLPGGTYIRYDGLEFGEDGMSYVSRHRATANGVSETRTRLYGGILMENIVQALARRVVGDEFLDILDRLKYITINMTSHDEGVFVVPNRYAERAARVVKECMSTPPEWAPDLPVACDVHISKEYDK